MADEGVARWFWCGDRDDVRDAIAARIGSPPLAAGVGEACDGDTIVVDPTASHAVLAALPHRHAFSAVREWKRRGGTRVFVLVDADDEVGVQLARFVLADGVLIWDAASAELDGEELGARGGTPRRPSVDDLLARLQREAGDSGHENSLQRLMRFEREDSLLTTLQDPETGLFDGPYATLKIDEEWKRSHRFHQPLSLLLLDLGFASPLAGADRRAALAEAAGVFLNVCRDIDVLARFSENVFLFLLPGTGAEGARVLSERLVASLRERLQGRFQAAPVGGLATVPSGDVRDRRRFVAVAEACLERARAEAASGGGGGGVCTSWQ